jgi:hypothetical protein
VFRQLCGAKQQLYYDLLVAVPHFNKLQLIDHKFPESGHSFLDSDRDFALVEKQVKNRQNMYSVDDYHSIMAASQAKRHPSVSRIDTKFSMSKELPHMLHLINRTVKADGEKCVLETPSDE